MRTRSIAATALAMLAAAAAPAATIGYTTHTHSLVVTTLEGGRLAEAGSLFGRHELQAGYPAFGVGYAYALIGAGDGLFRALAETGGEPTSHGSANAGGTLEFWVTGSDATWTATAQGRLGGSAELVDLTSGLEWRVRYDTWPAPVVPLVDGHAYRMRFGAGGDSTGTFYPGGSARVEIRNATFVDVPEPGTLPLAVVALGGVALAGGVRRVARR